MNFKKLNLYVGLFIGFVSSLVYVLTMEATISFWDCGEFVSCAYKLENPHPAGAPTFVLFGRIMAILFGDSPHTAVHALNSLSAVSSGLSMMFLYWVIVFFAKKIILKKDSEEVSISQQILIFGSGIVGAFAASFADSIWFSAVEGEVYGLAMFLNIFMFWVITYWYEKEDGDNHDRWIIFLFFVIGFSIGVHLLNILVIPTLVIAYFLKRFPINRRNIIIGIITSIIITGFVQSVLIQHSVSIAAEFDNLFVNVFGLPVFSGFLAFFVLLFFAIRYGIRYFNKKRNYNVVLFLNAVSFIFIGYSTFFIVLIRSNAFVPINMGNADNPYTLKAYLARDQYGSHPFLYGQVFTAGQDLTHLDKEHQVNYEKKGNKYNLVEQGGKLKYDVVSEQYEPVFHSDDKMLFPRMWNTNNNRGNADFYARWVGINKAKDPKTGFVGYTQKPTFAQNLNFFFTYQMVWMYLRYFMWNYAGRQNDVQGLSNDMHGNVISGISFIDNILVGNQDLLPTSLKQLRSHNTLFFLPFLLGILGMFFHYKRTKKEFLIALLFFFFNGLAIVLYLNDPGPQPRERDYTHAVSYLGFAIWIGLGVIHLAELLSKYLKKEIIRNVVVVLACFLLVPILMASQEWDDHDRSNKIIAKSVAQSYLQSCDTNALLMCYADNDTYPLWYAQEVEEIRNDVRVVNTSLMGIGWYVEQLKRKMNNNDAFDVLFTRNQLVVDDYQYIRVQPDNRFNQSQYYDLYDVMKNFVLSNNKATKQVDREGNMIPYLPVTKFSVPVSKAGKKYYMSRGIPEDKIYDKIFFEIPKERRILTMDYLSMLAIIATHDWQRPLCFTNYENSVGFGKYLRREGLVYRLVPFSPYYYSEQDLDRYVSLVQNDFLPLKKNKDKYTFFDETNRINISDLKSACVFYASLLNDRGRKEQSQMVLDHLFGNYFFERDLPLALAGRFNSYNKVSFDVYRTCVRLNDTIHANQLSKALRKDLKEQIAYYSDPNQPKSFQQSLTYEHQSAKDMLKQIVQIDSIYMPVQKPTLATPSNE